MTRVGIRALAVTVPAVFVAGIGLTMVLNLWQTESSKVPARYTTGELAGRANPADIRGSYTLADIERSFDGVTVALLADAFGVTESPAVFQVKSLETQAAVGPYEVGTDSVRLFVALSLGLPYEPEETTGMPARAVELLLERGTVDAARAGDLRLRVVGGAAGTAPEPELQAPPETADQVVPRTDLQPGSQPEDHAAGSGVSTGADTTDRAVRGNTTFGDLTAWGVEQEDVKRLLGDSLGGPDQTVRTFAAEKGIEFSTVRAELQALVDAAR